MSGPTKPINDLADHITPAEPDDQMTGDQADKLRALCEKAGVPFDSTLSQAAAEQRIEELQTQLEG